jgi:hypothetical protein
MSSSARYLPPVRVKHGNNFNFTSQQLPLKIVKQGLEGGVSGTHSSGNSQWIFLRILLLLLLFFYYYFTRKSSVSKVIFCGLDGRRWTPVGTGPFFSRRHFVQTGYGATVSFLMHNLWQSSVASYPHLPTMFHEIPSHVFIQWCMRKDNPCVYYCWWCHF